MAKKSKQRRARKKATRPAPESTAADAQKLDFPIVGVGASAGGLEATEELFANMPTDTGMAFVVVTHQHPGHTSLLPELLCKKTEMQVVQATNAMQVEPNRVYVGPPGGHLAILALGNSEQLRTTSERLTNRELEIFRLIGEGLGSTQIADRLHLSPHTVDSHRENMKRKLGLSSATELNRAAVQWLLENG